MRAAWVRPGAEYFSALRTRELCGDPAARHCVSTESVTLPVAAQGIPALCAHLRAAAWGGSGLPGFVSADFSQSATTPAHHALTISGLIESRRVVAREIPPSGARIRFAA